MIEIKHRDTIESYGFDSFIGRRIDSDGEEFAEISLNFPFPSSYVRCDSLDFACFVMCINNKYKRRTLLNRSPKGNIYLGDGSVVRYEPFTSEQMSELERIYECNIDMKLFPNPFLYQLK